MSNRIQRVENTEVIMGKAMATGANAHGCRIVHKNIAKATSPFWETRSNSLIHNLDYVIIYLTFNPKSSPEACISPILISSR